MLDTLQFDDNREENILIVHEKYKIPSLWKLKEGNENITYCEFYPQSLEGYFNISKFSQRKAPYPLTYPLDYYHEIHINLPEDWNITPDEHNIENEYYQYEYSVRYEGTKALLSTHYKTKELYIPLTAFIKYVEDHAKMMNNLSYSLTYDKTLNKAASVKWPGIIVSIFALGLGVWLVIFLYEKYDPQPYYPAAWGQPIGGWLILVAIGLTFTPIHTLYTFITDPAIINGQAWLTMLLVERYELFGFYILEHIYNIVYLLFSVLVAVLFFQRRSSVPKLVSIFYGVTSIVTILDSIVSVQVNPSIESNGDFYTQILRSILVAAIWIPYFHKSLRVKKTFVTVRVDNTHEN